MTDRTALVEQFERPAQQHEAAQLGMWTFLASEMLLFGGILLGIVVYRIAYADVLATASHHLHFWVGGANTAVLLTSSLTMALAVAAAREGRTRATLRWLALTALIGTLFLGLKGYEYYLEYYEGLMPGIGPPFPLESPPTMLFFNLYFAATGLHAFHLTAGIVTVLSFVALLGTGRVRLPARDARIENLGLYWHLVDIIWVFLYPILYLI